MPIVAASIGVGVWVTRRNRQDLDRRYAGFRSLQYFGDEKIVKLGDFPAVGALYFDLAAKMVVGRKTFGPDHAEMAFTIGALKRIVAWHWRTPASWIEVQVGERGTQSTFPCPKCP
jgi:hypothetical protein